MELDIYNWTGRIVVWLFFSYVAFKIISFIFIEIINRLGYKFDTTWTFIEYIYYKQEFKEWVKNKQRIIKKNKIL